MTKQDRSIFGLHLSVRVSYDRTACQDCIFIKLLKWWKYEEISRIRLVDIHLIFAYFHRQDLCH